MSSARVSLKGMFGKEKEPLPDSLKTSAEKFSLSFTYGYALIPFAEQKEIEQLFPDLTDEIWKLNFANSNVLKTEKKEFSILDKTIKRSFNKFLTLSDLREKCDLHEATYKNDFSKLKYNAAELQTDARMHGTTASITYCFKLEVKDSLGQICSFSDFAGLREFIQNHERPSVKPSVRPGKRKSC